MYIKQNKVINDKMIFVDKSNLSPDHKMNKKDFVKWYYNTSVIDYNENRYRIVR